MANEYEFAGTDQRAIVSGLCRLMQKYFGQKCTSPIPSTLDRVSLLGHAVPGVMQTANLARFAHMGGALLSAFHEARQALKSYEMTSGIDSYRHPKSEAQSGVYSLLGAGVGLREIRVEGACEGIPFRASVPSCADFDEPAVKVVKSI